jgi:hypothetical protein
MLYREPKLYVVSSLDLVAAACIDGVKPRQVIANCTSGLEAGIGGCIQGVVASMSCAEGSAADSSCTAGFAQ